MKNMERTCVQNDECTIYYPHWVRVCHLFFTNRIMSIFIILTLGIPISVHVINPFWPIIICIIIIAGLGVSYDVWSGRLMFEAKRNYVLWLGKTMLRKIKKDPKKLTLQLCCNAGLSDVHPIRTAETPYWYSPKRLSKVAEAFLLGYKPPIVLYLVNEVLPLLSSTELGIDGSSSGLAGDLMMTFERMYLINPALGKKAADVLALGIFRSPSLTLAKRTLADVGRAEAISEILRNELAVADPQMHRAVVEAVNRLDAKIARYLL